LGGKVKMGVVIKDHTEDIKGATKQKASIFLREMADEMIIISTPSTPKDTGRMRMDVVKSVLGLNGKVKWGKNYSAIMEEKQFKNYTTAGTGPHFARDAAERLPGRTKTIAQRVGLI